MPLDDRLRPREFRPRCIVVRPIRGVVLNAVGLSGPGVEALLAAGKWQGRCGPFFLSFMASGGDASSRLADTERFAATLGRHLPFISPVGLQVNYSCPNVGHRGHDWREVGSALDILAGLDIPLVLKVNALEPTADLLHLHGHAALDGLCMGNTIPWGQLPDRIDWRGLFGSDVSPLAHLGGGGLSGRPLLLIVADRIADLRRRGFARPIVGGGGILDRAGADTLIDAGADAVELGVVGLLRPWRIRGIISHVNRRQSA